MIFFCEKCGISDSCVRTDLVGEPILCDSCYSLEIYGECDCDCCFNSYYEGDKMRCKVEICKPLYEV